METPRKDWGLLSKKDEELLTDVFYDRVKMAGLPKLLAAVGDRIPRHKVKEWYESQDVVQLLRPKPRLGKGRFPLIAWKPFDRVYMDSMFIAPLTIVTAIDLFSRFAFANAYRSESTSAEKARATLEDMLADMKGMNYKLKYWMPKTIYTDAGSEFQGVFRRALKEKDIEHVVSSPEDPLKNRPIERFNYTLRLLLEKQKAMGEQLNPRLVRDVLEAYNTTVHSSLIGHSPRDVLSTPEVREELLKHYADQKAEADQYDTEGILKEGTKVRYYTKRAETTFNKLGKNWSRVIYEVESWDRNTGLYSLKGSDRRFRRESLQVVDDKLYESSSKPAASEKPEGVRIRNIRNDTDPSLILTTKRERKPVTRIDFV